MESDKIKLDQPFRITCKACGSECELDKNETATAACPKCHRDLDRDEFVATCPNCGSTSPKFDNDVRMGSEWTGLYGCYTVTCKCGNEEMVFDP